MRAREPDEWGHVSVGGTKIAYEVHGSGEPSLLLMPTWTIIHARFWKAQVPYLARHFRVVTFDGPGNGASERPEQPEPYGVVAVAAAAGAVLDQTGTEAAVLVSLSQGAQWTLHLMAHCPERVLGGVFIGPALSLGPQTERRKIIGANFNKPYGDAQGWRKYNRYYWLDHYEDFLEFFFGEMFSEPHSTKQIEDCVGWGQETTPEVLLTEKCNLGPTEDEVRDWCALVRCPVLVIHGDQDAIIPHGVGAELAKATGGRLVTLQGAGHGPMARDPVKVNLLIREFVEQHAR